MSVIPRRVEITAGSCLVNQVQIVIEEGDTRGSGTLGIYTTLLVFDLTAAIPLNAVTKDSAQIVTIIERRISRQ